MQKTLNEKLCGVCPQCSHLSKVLSIDSWGRKGCFCVICQKHFTIWPSLCDFDIGSVDRKKENMRNQIEQLKEENARLISALVLLDELFGEDGLSQYAMRLAGKTIVHQALCVAEPNPKAILWAARKLKELGIE